MSGQSDFELFKILFDHEIPRGITIDTNVEELRKSLIESGLDRRFVKNLIDVLEAGITLRIEWEFFEDYDKDEMRSRIARRTMLKTEVVSELLDLLHDVCGIQPVESYSDLSFEDSDNGLEVSVCDKSIIYAKIPSMVIYNNEMREVNYISNFGFSSCESLTSIEIPDSVKGLGIAAFSCCISLKSVVIPNSVTIIGVSLFDLCKSLTSVIIPDSVEKIGNSAFQFCQSLNSIIIPDSVKEISDCAFYHCDSLEYIVIPSSVEMIGNGVFDGCTSLVSIDVSPDNKQYCSLEGVLYDKDKTVLLKCPPARQLKEFKVPDSVITIKKGSFQDCSHIVSIVMSDSVKEIDYAFLGCISLKFINIPDSVTKIDDCAFDCCRSLISLEVSSNNNYYESLSGVLYKKGMSALIKYPPNRSESSFSIPDSVTCVETGAFKNSRNLKYIAVPDSVIDIKKQAFGCCMSLESVDLHSPVTEISAGAFECCQSLKTIHLPKTVEQIGIDAFSHCPSLESITIPDSIIKISSKAFENCKSLRSVIVLGSIETIDDGAFYGCGSLDEKSKEMVLKINPKAIERPPGFFDRLFRKK